MRIILKIGLIQGSSRKVLNSLLFSTLSEVVDGKHEVINFGIFEEETVSFSYVEVAVMICLLIETGAVDFVVSGCSSGQGLMLACNNLPGLQAGYLPRPEDAYLFGRINNGNVASLSLGLDVGWASEITFKSIFTHLFDGEFGIGYPKQEARRKKEEAQTLNHIASITKRPLLEIIDELDKEMLKRILSREEFYHYLMENGKNSNVMAALNEVKLRNEFSI